MTGLIAATTLFVAQTAEALLQSGLELAAVLGLPVTTWRTGDPTRSLYVYLARALAETEQVMASYAQSGFLSTATGDWLRLHAVEVYGVTPAAATYATPSVVVTNTGGGYYPLTPGSFSCRSSFTGKIYTNTASVTFSTVGQTETIALAASEPGSASSVGVNQVDSVASGQLGLVIVSSTEAVGTDAATDEAVREQCRASLGALSPSGPRDAYEYVVRDSTLTGTTEITRATTVDTDVADGSATVYVAGPSGVVSSPALALAQAAVEYWAEPIGFQITVANGAALPIAYSATVHAENLPPGWQAAVQAKLAAFFAAAPIGGVVALSEHIAIARNELVRLGATGLSYHAVNPAADLTLAANQFPTISSYTLTEV